MGKGGMGGRHAATTQGFLGEVCGALAVAHPWASASSYLSSQSLADSRCNLHATSRPSHSRRSLPCHFLPPLSLRSLLPRPAAPPPAGPLFSRLLSPFGAAPPSLLRILAPQVYRALLAQGRVF